MTEEDILIRLRAMGVASYVASMREAAGATTQLGLATDVSGRAMGTAARRGFVMNQMLFTMRRLVYGVSLGLIAGTVSIAKWGFEFNNTMAGARTALQPLIPNVEDLNGVLNQLFRQAQYSPFTFQDTTMAFRNMFVGMSTLGISSGTVLTTMQSIMDTLSVAGRTTPASLNRVSYALQHMAFQGRLTGQVVNQLGRDGIPVAAILRKEFGLTGDQLHNISKLGIPTLAFLQAFNRYTQENAVFSGAARRQSLNTFSGQFATFKDTMSQIMGAVERGFFRRSMGMINNLNNFIAKTGNLIQTMGPRATPTAVLVSLFPGSDRQIREVLTDLRLFWQLIENIVRSVSHAGMIWYTLGAAFLLLHGILLILNPLVRDYGGFIVNLLIPAFITWIALTRTAAFWTGVNTAVTGASTLAIRDMTFAQFLLNGVLRAYFILQMLIIRRTEIYTAVQVALWTWTRMLKFEMMALWLVFELNPIILIVTAIVLLVGGLVILYFKWQRFHDLVNKTFRWMRGHWRDMILFLGPLGFAIRVAMFLFDRLWGRIKTIYNWIVDRVHWLRGVWRFFFGGGGEGASPVSNLIRTDNININRGVNAPVRPLPPMPRASGAFVGRLSMEPTAPVELHLDGRKVANTVAKWRIRTEGLQAGASG